MSSEKTFQNFIISLFERGDIPSHYVTDASMETFRRAFTHKSLEPVDNYEFLEIIGDVVVNMAVLNYIIEWNKKIVSVKYLTRLKHNITSKKELALLAEKAGFFKHIRMSDELRESFESLTEHAKHRTIEYLSILEDCFEAFLGAVQRVVDSMSRVSFGVGVAAAHKLCAAFLKDVKISLKYEDVFDAKTRLKELCDRRKWRFKQDVMKSKKIVRNGVEQYEVEITVFPYGNRQVDKTNAWSYTLVGETETETQNIACEHVIKFLKKNGIEDVPPNPFKIEN